MDHQTFGEVGEEGQHAVPGAAEGRNSAGHRTGEEAAAGCGGRGDVWLLGSEDESSPPEGCVLEVLTGLPACWNIAAYPCHWTSKSFDFQWQGQAGYVPTLPRTQESVPWLRNFHMLLDLLPNPGQSCC